MQTFIQKHSSKVIGVLSGFDRLVFRGSLRRIAYSAGMDKYLGINRVLYKDYGRHVEEVTSRVKAASVSEAKRLGREVRYLPSSRISKEAEARQMAERHHITDGLIGVLSCLTLCYSYEMHRDREQKMLRVRACKTKCLHYYHYWFHPEFGFCHGRIQTYFPFSIQVCLNGREWLARQMDRAGIGYLRRENGFVWIEDMEAAQALMQEQLHTPWPKVLDEIALRLNPIHHQVFGIFPADYYWTAHQSEWATDLMFARPRDLAELYPRLVHHAMSVFGSPDVMRFLGRFVPASGNVPLRFGGEAVTDLKVRPEGMRVKHRLNRNQIKMYDKQGSVLRVETTINDPKDFRVFRPKEGDASKKQSWRVLRKGVADLARRSQVSQSANERYLEALSYVESDTPLGDCMNRISRAVTRRGRKVRGLRPWGEDALLLASVSRGEYQINGFRNRDIRRHIFPKASRNKKDAKTQAGQVTYRLRLLRSHGLIKKVPRTHRYVLTAKGRLIVSSLAAIKNVGIQRIMELAA